MIATLKMSILPGRSDMAEFNEFQDRVIASMSGVMLKISEGPMDALKQASSGKSMDPKVLASLSDNLRKLASQASLAASLAAVMAKAKR